SRSWQREGSCGLGSERFFRSRRRPGRTRYSSRAARPEKWSSHSLPDALIRTMCGEGVTVRCCLRPPPTKPHTPDMLRALDADKILETLDRLGRRIHERFPNAGLNKVAAQLLSIGRDTERRAAFVNRPYVPLRLLAGTLIVLLVAVVVLGVVASLRVSGRIENLGSLMQALEATVNDIVFVGVAIWFLVTIETRLKRRTA